MYNCPNCGTGINQGEKFCRKCGTPVATQQVATPMFQGEQQPMMQQPMMQQPGMEQPMMQQQPMFQGEQQMTNQSAMPQPMNQPVMPQPVPNGMGYGQSFSQDDMLVDAYIGKNAANFKDGKFSSYTFLFGIHYMFYRKMWLLAIIWMLISYIVSSYLSTFSTIIMIAANVFVACNFKKWYLSHVKEKVAKIKSENPGASFEQLRNICSKKGGTSVLVLVIYIILEIIYIILASLLMVALRTYADIYGSETDYNDTNNGVVETADDSKFGELSINIPDGFVGSQKNTTSYRIYNLKDENNNCKLTMDILATTKYATIDEYFSENVHYTSNDLVLQPQIKTVNNKDWNYMSVQTGSKTTYYYAILINDNKIYNFKYEIIQDNGTCSSDLTNIVDSLSFE